MNFKTSRRIRVLTSNLNKLNILTKSSHSRFTFWRTKATLKGTTRFFKVIVQELPTILSSNWYTRAERCSVPKIPTTSAAHGSKLCICNSAGLQLTAPPQERETKQSRGSVPDVSLPQWLRSGSSFSPRRKKKGLICGGPFLPLFKTGLVACPVPSSRLVEEFVLFLHHSW